MTMQSLIRKLIATRAGRLGLPLLAGAALALVCGCEIDSADSSISINPTAAHVNHVGQTVTLTASGGYRYQWSLSNNQIGMLNTYEGNQVVYISLTQPTSLPEVQAVRVTSYFADGDNSDTGGTSTNNTPTTTVHTAEAYITHMITSTN